MKNQHLAVEMFELLLSGDASDKKHAEFLANRMDTQTLARLREVANELAILAEKMYFEKRREMRRVNP
jgi:hypothetical protein